MIPTRLVRRIEDLRRSASGGDHCDQTRIAEILRELEPHRTVLQADEKDELLSLVDSLGRPRPITAPRWLCHILGLRHRAVHVAIRWDSPGLGPSFVFQVRSWSKFEYPGHIDLSATGHVQLVDSVETSLAAMRELQEELGLTSADLTSTGLELVFGYENVDTLPQRHFLNVEWRDVYIGTIRTDALGSFAFPDSEVIGIFLCPLRNARDLLAQSHLPLAGSLRDSLPRLLNDHRRALADH